MIAKSAKPLKELVQDIRDIVGPVYYDTLDLPYDLTYAKRSARGILNPPPKDLLSFGKYDLETYELEGKSSGIELNWGDCRWLLIEFLNFRPVIRLHCESTSPQEVSRMMNAGSKCFKVQVSA